MALAVLLALSLEAVAPQAPTTTRASVAPGPVQGNWWSEHPAISGDGRFVGFMSHADNLVSGDLNGVSDVFVHDRLTGTLERVSVATGGIEANSESQSPSLSRDGRFVAFRSRASNLVPGDVNGVWDVFVHDRQTATTTMVSVGPGGVQADSDCLSPTISADGTAVIFSSWATTLVAGDTNGWSDVFVRDLAAGATTRVSVSSTGVQGNLVSDYPHLSADGRWAIFQSSASTLVSGDTNGFVDVFLHDRATGTTTLVSRDSAGVQGNHSSYGPSVSGDGSVVAFYSYATNLAPLDANGEADAFVRDLASGVTTRISEGPGGVEGDGSSYVTDIGDDGRSVGFYSYATNLVTGDGNGEADCFRYEVATGTVLRVSVDESGGQGNDRSGPIALSRDGRSAVFASDATNLVPGDTNGWEDVFVRALAPLMHVEGLTPGGTATVSFTLAEPGALLYPALSTTGPGPSPSGLGFDVDLDFPVTRLNPLTADAAGEASAPLPVPPNAPPGLTVWWHGVERVGAAFRPTTALATVVE